MEENNKNQSCKFCSDEIYQICKVEVIGKKEEWIIGLCMNHFHKIANSLSYDQREALQ